MGHIKTLLSPPVPRTAQHLDRLFADALVAMSTGAAAAVERILRGTPALLAHVDGHGRSIILEACRGGNSHVAVFRAILSVMRDTSGLDVDGVAARTLRTILQANANELLAVLLDAGLSPDVLFGGQFPLIVAAICHRADRCVRLLLDRGANPKARAINGHSCLHIARSFGLSAIAQMIDDEIVRRSPPPPPIVMPAAPIREVAMMSSSPRPISDDVSCDIAEDTPRWSQPSPSASDDGDDDGIKSPEETLMTHVRAIETADSEPEEQEQQDEAPSSSPIELPARVRRELAALEEGQYNMGRMMAGKRQRRRPARFCDN